MFSKTNENIAGVPLFISVEISEKKTKYCLCIPIINEAERIINQLQRAQIAGIDKLTDIIICDGDSTDGSTEIERLKTSLLGSVSKYVLCASCCFNVSCNLL